MKVSIIIPVYNVENYIAECIQSVINQDYSDIECIIVDDCSSDKSMTVINEILSEYRGPFDFVVIRQQVNRGVSFARNSGIKKASGDYLFFMDSDDYLLSPHDISLFVKYAKLYPNVDSITGRYIGNLESGNYLYKDDIIIENRDDYSMTILYMLYCGIVNNKLIKRSFIVDNNLFFDEGYIYEDVMWYIRSLAYLTQNIVIPEKTYYYRPNPNGIMSSSSFEKSFRSRVKLLSLLFLYIEKDKKSYYLYNLGYQILTASYILTQTESLDENDVLQYIKYRKQFVRKSLCSHPIMWMITLFLYYPFNKLLDVKLFRNNLYSLLGLYRKL